MVAKKGKFAKLKQDRYYKLAKETGFRSRASFKLLQLNRKFEFLQKSRVLIDLCAAPGGWLQVAHQAMPVSSIIIGVDLYPIKHIPNVITLQEDITTDKCKQSLKRELKTWKADAILHDGSPNLGKDWGLDAFTQNQLTLSALKLATEMLVRGGWFVTKVFRSRDYLALVWVFKKLFKKVHITKPQASRTESAEVFIVCEGYEAPDQIDPKFLDPNHVFKEVKSTDDSKFSILKPSKKKIKAEGYEHGDASVFSQIKASDFVYGDNHIQQLSNASEIILDDEDIRDHKLTTDEIKECCKDIRVLGQIDLRSLLKWRKELIKAAEEAELKGEDNEKSEDQLDEEKEIYDALEEAEEIEVRKFRQAKRKKKNLLKLKEHIKKKFKLKMVIENDVPIIQEDRSLFKMSLIKNDKELAEVEDEYDLEFGPSFEMDADTIQKESNKMKYSRFDKLLPCNDEPENSSEIDSSDEDNDDNILVENDSDLEKEEEEEEEQDFETKNPLLKEIISKPEKNEATVIHWFDDKDFNYIASRSELDLKLLAENELQKEKSTDKTGKPLKGILKVSKPENENTIGESEGSVKMLKSESSSEAVMEDDVEENSNGEVVKETRKTKKKKIVKLDPEELALGSLLVSSKKRRRDIIDNAYNRFAFNDTNLPTWFVEDEAKHYRKEMPVTKEMIEEYKLKERELNARPVKKVIQAKARRKRRTVQKLQKIKKRAQKITDHLGMSDKEKMEQLRVLYKNARPKEEKVTYVVSKKALRVRAQRPAGVKGPYVIVDKRMKKDDRVKKQATKAKYSRGKKQRNTKK